MYDIFSQIQSNNINIDDGIRKINDCLYKSAFNIFGTSTYKQPMHCTKKKQLRVSNTVYRKNSSLYNGDVLIACKLNAQRSKFSTLAENSPGKCWSVMRKVKYKK